MKKFSKIVILSLLAAIPACNQSSPQTANSRLGTPATNKSAPSTISSAQGDARSVPETAGPGVDKPATGVSTYPTFHIAKILKQEMLYEKAPFPSCHASTIVETPAGLVAAFFGGTAERNPDVCIWVCRLVNGKWTAPQNVADGILAEPLTTASGNVMPRVATWNPVLFQPKEGPLYLFYKVGPAPAQWWGEFKTSTDNGKTWSKATRLADGLIGPVKDKPIQLDDGTVVSGSSTENGGSHVHIELSYDNCKTWTRLPDIAGPSAIQPTVLKHVLADGGIKLQILCRTSADVLVESWSTDKGKTWSPLVPSKLPNPGSGVDGVSLADGRQVLVYNPTKRSDPQKGRTPLNIAVSTDGINWKDVLTLDNDLAGQYSYPGVIQSKDGIIHIVYTYHRKTIKYVTIDPKSF